MATRHVVIDGVEYLPSPIVHLHAPLRVRKAARVLAAAIALAKADDAVDEHGGLEALDRATALLKTAVRAFEQQLFREGGS